MLTITDGRPALSANERSILMRIAREITAAALFIANTAFAQSENLAHDVPQATLTMAQAVTIAETVGNGRATHARFDGAAAQPFYRVRVVAPSAAALNLKIAAAGGRILSSERVYDH
jgi:uncharacterized membrane protein YkoI